MSERAVRCPKCGSETLTLVETHEEHGAVGPRCFVTNEHGAIVVDEDFDFEPGDTVRVELWCEVGCGHSWRSRRPIDTWRPTTPPAPPARDVADGSGP